MASSYKNPAVTTDIIVIRENKVLLIRRKNDPHKGHWALPGGFLDEDESAPDCARRELFEETGLKLDLCEYCTVSTPGRDPRGRTVTICYLARLDSAPVSEKNGTLYQDFELSEESVDTVYFQDYQQKVRAGDDAERAEWFIASAAEVAHGKYILTLEGGDESLSAEIKAELDNCGKMDFEQTKILKNDKIAFDHSKIILKCLLNI